MSVGPANDEAFMGGPATRVAIFLSIFDVHVQRAPLDGKVALYAYHPGGYAAAWKGRDRDSRGPLARSRCARSRCPRNRCGVMARFPKRLGAAGRPGPRG